MLDALSFTTGQIEKLVIKVKKLLKSALDNNEGVLAAKTAQLNTVDKKIEELEESYFRKDIELSTYKRWFAKQQLKKVISLMKYKRPVQNAGVSGTNSLSCYLS